MKKAYFYESYAIIGYLEGNAQYRKFFEKAEGATTIYNLLEVYYAYLRKHGERVAEEILGVCEKWIIAPFASDVGSAMKLKLESRKRRLSYIDCLGYVMAKREGLRFLTGDKEFESMENVEFVKV